MEKDVVALFAVESFKKFGKRLESLRKSRNLTQSKLCLKSGVSRNSISAYECNKRLPQLATLEKLAAALQIECVVLDDQQSFNRNARQHLCNFDSETGEFYLSSEK
ncbi:helix-turn-helix transcriptional regulator [Lentisphaerota bacterium ZTH]|nr:helix-turn-helix transcriptional regulator [Lentisphaerota bacterium]WET07527.1 helix-turn-helix transcriptional regulator [Lentisphaerota bacterium ZTH]